MYSPKKKLDVPPKNFNFPFTPYKIQEDLMQKLYSVIENKKIGIFESPTGTGKSLTLTCGALKWLEDHDQLVRSEIDEELQVLNKEIQNLQINELKSVDWIDAQYKEIQKKSELNVLKKIKDEIEEYENKLNVMKKKVIEGRKNTNVKKLKQFSNRTEDDTTEEKLSKNSDDDLLLQESEIDDDDDDKINENEEECFKNVKIFFCSRTHSQLSQVVREIKKTSYGNYVRCISLSSRQNLCVNLEVKKLQSLSQINEKCLDLQNSQSKTTSFDTEGQPKKKSRTKQVTKCPYKNSVFINELKEYSLVEIHDIEDLVQAGKSLKACPYYSGREAQKDAQIIMFPYQILLHKKTRKQSGIDLKNNIVIIDEAHNLLDTLTSIYSSEISLEQLETCSHQLLAYKKKYENRFCAKNLLKLNQIIFIVKRLIKLLNVNSNQSNKSRMIKTYELMHEGEFFNLNLFEILQFCEKSRLAQKVHGLAQRLAILQEQNSALNNETKLPENRAMLLKNLEEKLKNKKSKSKKMKSPIQPTVQTKYNKNQSTKAVVQVIRPFLSFLESLTECAADGMILITYDENPKKAKMKFILLNPHGHFQEIINDCRSLIIAGGTMQPTNELIQQLFKTCLDRVEQHFYGHVVPNESVTTFVLQKGPSLKKFLLNYSNRNNPEMIKELGMTFQNLCGVIPAGIVCFFPSYDYLDYIYDNFLKQGVLSKIESKKFIFREPRSSNINGQSLEQILNDYKKSIQKNERNGAIMFSVVGGKLSEGLNFSDDLGRCVIVVGMPYPNKDSPELVEKMKYLNINVGNESGREYYENLCMKAVNQCIGRAIRHINDYACVILLDERYSNEKVLKKLPKWISKSVKIPDNYGVVQRSIAKFFHEKS